MKIKKISSKAYKLFSERKSPAEAVIALKPKGTRDN
jgi:hypothetical protein